MRVWQKIKNVYHLLNAFLANVWFGFPSETLTVIGVTGTDGKTTTVSLIYHILRNAKYNVSMISSVGAIIGGKNYDVGFHVTTPSPWQLQRFIRKALLDTQGSTHPLNDSSKPSGDTRMFNKNSSIPTATFQSNHDYRERVKRSFCGESRPPNYLVLEVTSHALDQYRVWGVKFDVGVLTNVTHEHLDYHKTYKNYVGTKAKLLKSAKVAIVNRDDESYKLISKINSAKPNQKSKIQIKNKKWVTYGLKENTDVNPKNFPFKTNLIGEFNRYNVLAAVGVAKELRIDDNIIKNAISSFKAPIGREEIVYPTTYSKKNNFTVMIDFAHTPNAFEQILSSIKPSIKSRLIHVFGAAGERDVSKRPLMGRVSAKYADIIILTAEDPRSESVEKIMEEIASGIKTPNYNPSTDGQTPNKSKIQIYKISNRQKAIIAAIKMAKKGDFVLITGKAHEKSMNYGRGEEPWDEFEVARGALMSRRGPARSFPPASARA